ncbi:Aminoglycoside 3'-phosphotransferase [bioreactor metagenome]|uniref:Aminoglycoside 3'-phosphotransferase n=1 Tax=bioreactor metagenome TaxID=1076179 RepID=A0A645CCD1_9ZZZZ
MDDLNDDTLSEDGFSDIQALYDFLCAKRPKQDFALSLSHGDYCLPNVFVSGDKAVGFLDLGNAGVADIWQDIALCVRSFEHNLCLYGYNNNDFIKYKELLFNELGIKPDEEKIKYYILLDELF